ncbi:MAG: hypothetical protein P8P29_08075, partial [Flavobacteriaceae bacterium]|nr:hypothetical protein [Flavobacteriaceae bacterium]
MKYKNKSKRKKKKRGGNFNLSYQYGGNTGAFPNMNNLNIPGFNSSGNLDFSHVQGNLDAMNNAVLMGQVTAGMSGLADLQNNPGIQKMNLAQATVNPNRGFGAPPFQMGGSIDAYDKFDLAFAAARKSGKETFTYKGKSYNTKLKQKITSATSSSNSTKGTHSNGDSIDIKGEMPTKDRWANIPKNNFVIPPNGDIKPHVPSNHVPSNISDFDMLDIPQAMMMKAITGKYQKPGDLVRERGYGPFAQGLTNVVADPLNLIPYTKLKYLGNAVRKIGDQTALGNNLYSLVKGTLKADNAKDFIEPFRDTPKHQMGGYTPTKPKATSLEDKYNALRLKNATDVEETKEFLGDYEKYRKAENNKIDANLKKVEEMLRAADRAADMAKQGYSDNSPYGKEKSIVIPGNNIDMSNTSRPILGIPDIGETILMAPNSGSYNFPKATKVTEIPFGEKFQMGGGIGRDEEDRRYAQEVDSMRRLYEQRAEKKRIEKSLSNSDKETTNTVNSVGSEDVKESTASNNLQNSSKVAKSNELPSFKEVEGQILNTNYDEMVPYYQQRKSYGSPQPVNLEESSKVAKPNSTTNSMKSFDANEDPFIFGSSFSEMGSDSNSMGSSNANEDPMLSIMGSGPNEMGNLYIEGMGLTRTEESKEDSNFLKKDKDFFNYKDYMLKTYGMGSFEDIL